MQYTTFWEISETVFKKELFLFDNTISMFFYHLRNPLLTSIMRFFTFIGMDGILVFSILIPLFLFWKKRKYEAVLFTIMISTGAALNMLLKVITQRPRPTFAPLVTEHSFSFPSGHSMNSFIFFMTLAYFYYHFTHKKRSSLLAFLVASIIILCIGISRIYLGVHYPSDVLGGYIVGLIWFLFVIIVDKIILSLRLFKTK
jgi:undecaprenyl-diphosphatase